MAFQHQKEAWGKRDSFGSLREGGIRVPLIVSWKTHIPAGRELDTPVTSMDAVATAVDLARATSGKTKLDGISLMPLLAGQVVEWSERPLFWRVGKQNAMRVGDWKLERNGKEWQLYNLAHDIGEGTDLAAHEPARVQQMSALWDKWNAEQVEPLWR